METGQHVISYGWKLFFIFMQVICTNVPNSIWSRKNYYILIVVGFLRPRKLVSQKLENRKVVTLKVSLKLTASEQTVDRTVEYEIKTFFSSSLEGIDDCLIL